MLKSAALLAHSYLNISHILLQPELHDREALKGGKGARVGRVAGRALLRLASRKMSSSSVVHKHAFTIDRDRTPYSVPAKRTPETWPLAHFLHCQPTLHAYGP